MWTEIARPQYERSGLVWSGLRYPVPEFDFSVPGVRSMSADLHKLAYAAKPASTVFYRSPVDFERVPGEFLFSLRIALIS